MDDVKLLRERLWGNGFRPISILTGQKRPYRDNYIERAMKNPPEAVLETVYPFCASTAILCYGLRSLDLDIDDAELCEAVQKVALEIFGPCPIRYRHDSPRRLFLYKDSSCAASKKFITFENEQGIEILGCRQKFLAFGQHEKGAQYQWVNDYSPLSIRAQDLIEFDESKIDLFRERCALIAPLKKEKVTHVDIPSPSVNLDSGHFRKYALGALQSIEKELSLCVKGGRNNLLNSSAFRLGSMGARGWLQFDECQAALKRACESNGLIKQDGNSSWMHTFKSGWTSGMSKPAHDPINKTPYNGNHYTPPILPIETRCQVLLDTSNDEEEEIQPLDDSLTYVPGIMGHLINWITDSGPSGNRFISLSSALAMMSLLLGRNIATPTEGSLEMYIILTAPTGSGKAHVARSINSLIKALKLERHMADDEFKSGAYIEDLIQTKPLCLSIQDEFGQILAQITAPNASLNMSQVSTNLRKLWGINFDVFRTGGAKSRPSIAVHAPHLTICGLTTSHQLFSSVKSKDISNGIMNRFLLIDAGDERTICENLDKPSVKFPPPELIRDLYHLYMMGAPREGNLAGLYDKNFITPTDIFHIPWARREARNMFFDLQKECFTIMDQDPDLGEVYARTAFYAVKLATLLACGENLEKAKVDISHMEWGCKLAKLSSDTFFKKARENMSETLSYSEIWKKIVSILSVSNPEGLPPKSMQRRKLFDRIKNYCNKNASDPSNCLRELERNEIIICHNIGKVSVVTLI